MSTVQEQLAGMLQCRDIQIATDLIGFYNMVEESLDIQDLHLLADLQNGGRFQSWECPTCGERVYQATPEDWDYFQGCYNPDYVSFPEGHKRQCDDCRMRSPLTKKDAQRLGLVLSEMLEPVSAEESLLRLMSAFRV